MTTELFIWIAIGVIAIADIVFLYFKIKRLKGELKKTDKAWGISKTITECFRHWYNEFPFTTFAVGAVFIGHFYLYQFNKLFPPKISIWVFIVFSILYLVWNIIEGKRKKSSRLFNIMLGKLAIIPMCIGAYIGSFWR